MATERLVIGIGNQDRGDDGVGPFVVHGLVCRVVAAITCRGDITELMTLWSEYANVVVVDAMRAGGPAGQIRRVNPADGPLPVAAYSGSTHAVGLAEAIELSRYLGRLPDQLIVIGIEGRGFDVGGELSPTVRAAGERIIAELLESGHA